VEYDKNEVMALAQPGASIVFCVAHGIPGSPDYKVNCEKIVLAFKAALDRQ
jgi:hypothetical protein